MQSSTCPVAAITCSYLRLEKPLFACLQNGREYDDRRCVQALVGLGCHVLLSIFLFSVPSTAKVQSPYPVVGRNAKK